jgi:hypothetical protein
LVMLSIGSLYEGHKKYCSRFSNHLLKVFQAFFFGLGSGSNGFILFQNSTDIL